MCKYLLSRCLASCLFLFLAHVFYAQPAHLAADAHTLGLRVGPYASVGGFVPSSRDGMPFGGGLWYTRAVGQSPLLWTVQADLLTLGQLRTNYPAGAHPRYADFDAEVVASGEAVSHSIISKGALALGGLVYSPLRLRSVFQPHARLLAGTGYVFSRSRDQDPPMLDWRILDGSPRTTQAQMPWLVALGLGLDLRLDGVAFGLHTDYLRSLNAIAQVADLRYDQGAMQARYQSTPLQLLHYSLSVGLMF